MNIRGRYEGGGYVVTAKHWWSPRERKSARLSAMVLESKKDELEKQTRAAMRDLLFYGELRTKPEWNDR